MIYESRDFRQRYSSQLIQNDLSLSLRIPDIVENLQTSGFVIKERVT